LATGLDQSIGTNSESGVYAVGLIIGLLSSIVDNVPLVAAAMGMYPLAQEGFFMQDGLFWEFLAYCAGTGGSALIIGSAAGVAVMGLEKITFGWYLKNISFLAILGYFSGAVIYIISFSFH
jgi:Na+/H+ antiporter NhaD/arsenite permease-like protein